MTKWQFPVSTVLEPGEHLVVFASNKDVVTPNGERHTNFQLTSGGEYLALVMPNGTSIANEFAPSFPPQAEDVSYGLLTELSFVEAGQATRVLVPTSEAELPADWKDPGISTDDWIQGTTNLGFDLSTMLGLKLWLEADDTPVSVWRDRSGHNHDLATVTDLETVFQDPIKQQVTITVPDGTNTFPVVRFSRADELMRAADIIVAEDANDEASEDESIGNLTIITVYQSSQRSGRNRPVGFGISSGLGGVSRNNFHLSHEPAIRKDNGVVGAGSYGQATPSDFFIRTATMTGSGGGLVEEFFNGESVMRSLQPYNVRSDNFYLGDLNRAGGFAADVAEVMVFDRVLTSSDREAIENYLTHKFFIADAVPEASVGPYAPLIATDLFTQMPGQNAAAFLRAEFDVEDPAVLSQLTLQMQYDDGFVAYLNGEEVASRNAPAMPVWNSAATDEQPDEQAVLLETIDLSEHLDLLQLTGNVLAIQGLNVSAGDEDFLIVPQLRATIDILVAPLQFFDLPTPGQRNKIGYVGWLKPPNFSVPGGTFIDEVMVELTTDQPDVQVRYTVDGTAPSESSSLFADPISITVTTQLRARTFRPDFVPSLTVSESYFRIGADLVDFTSDLPLMVLDTFEVTPTVTGFTSSSMALFSPGEDGRTSLDARADVVSRAGVKIRGRTSAGYPKRHYALEIWEQEADEDLNMSLLGMPAESDWVLYPAYHYDRSFVANTFTFELLRQLGYFSPRTQYFELFVNNFGDKLTFADNYVGTYVLVEKVKRNDQRVALDKVSTKHATEPQITGGYLFKHDFLDPGDVGFRTARGTSINYVDPKEKEIIQEQAEYIVNYFNAFEDALESEDFAGPELGYAAFIDVPSFIDDHLINELSHNNDGLRLSTFLHKPRGEKLIHGPLWDFDKSYTWGGPNGDDISQSAETWYGGRFSLYWSRLFQDLDFQQRYIDRWQELRAAQLSVANFQAIVDGLAARVVESQARNFVRWPQFLPRNLPAVPELDGTWQGEVAFFKDWLERRAHWIDGKFLGRPTVEPDGGADDGPFTVALAGPPGATILYTTDGSDPRMPGGEPLPTALVYDGSIEITETTVLSARAHDPSFDSDFVPNAEAWSGLSSALFELGATPSDHLRISEVHYHPPDVTDQERAAGITDEDDFEFIELVNIGASTIQLAGVELVQENQQGVAFDFDTSPISQLGPGERVVVVEDVAAFQLRYGDGLPVAGQWTGGLNNNREQITLSDDGITILQFTYNDDWFPTTDGVGLSLEIVNAANPNLESWGERSSWQPSAQLGGTPGADRSNEPVLRGDLDRDGDVDPDDVGAFVLGIGNPIAYAATYGALPSLHGDTDEDGDLDFDDIAGFVDALEASPAATATLGQADSPNGDIRSVFFYTSKSIGVDDLRTPKRVEARPTILRQDATHEPAELPSQAPKPADVGRTSKRMRRQPMVLSPRSPAESAVGDSAREFVFAKANDDDTSWLA